MQTVFYARSYSSFLKAPSNLRRKKLHEQIKAPIFLEAALALETLQERQRNLGEKGNLGIIG